MPPTRERSEWSGCDRRTPIAITAHDVTPAKGGTAYAMLPSPRIGARAGSKHANSVVADGYDGIGVAIITVHLVFPVSL